MGPSDGRTPQPDDVRGADNNPAAPRSQVLDRLNSNWPGRTVVRTAAAMRRVEIADRSMTIAAQLFTSIFPILILFATWATRRDADRIADATLMPEETQSVLEDAITAAGDTAFGAVGVLIVLLSATGMSRALTRAFAVIWELPRPKTRVSAAWRWIAVVLALALSLLAVRWLGRWASDQPLGPVVPVAVTLTSDVVIALFVPWILLAGIVAPRMLLPGALIGGLVGLAERPLIEGWLPSALAASSDRYGPIGVAFTYLAMLSVVSFCFLAASIVGQVIATDEGKVGQWLRQGRWAGR